MTRLRVGKEIQNIMNKKLIPGQNLLPQQPTSTSWVRRVITVQLQFALIAGLLLASQQCIADVLLIDSVQSANTRYLPRTGQLMDEVRSEWGEPVAEYRAVGTPPITRWEFQDFSVYFEYDHVINSVIHEGVALNDSQ